MSEIISIDMPDAVLDRFRRAAAGARRPVHELLVNALANFAPKPPPGLSEDLRKELEALESFSDDELRHAFEERMPLENLPEEYSADDGSDRLMMRKAYAGLLLQWRGYELPSLRSTWD